MKDILFFAGTEKSDIFFTVFIAAYIAMASLMMSYIITKRKKNKSDKEKAYQLLLKGNEQDTLNDHAIYLIYRRMIAKYYSDFSYVDFWESFLLYVRLEDKDGTQTKKMVDIINPILEKEKKEKPYSSVEERERRILLAIEDSANKGETAAIKHNLEDLSIVIEKNQKALDRALVTNRWTIPTSIIGVLLTLFIWIYGSSLSEKDVQRISNQIYTTVSDSLNSTKE